mmetsp:Transcript_576/g.1367  ORF Transcript_576/g.1367 Transcript_576/m.1367 type:complete len:416 (-) Transcript_576:41-1288(-)
MRTMRLLTASTLISAAAAAVPAVAAVPSAASRTIKSGSIEANSPAGRRILSHATRTASSTSSGTSTTTDLSHVRALDEEQEQDISFVSSYSIKFQGCHYIAQWNDEADGEDDVRVATKSLVRFRLCPADSCFDDETIGCSNGYGDYIIDMSTFLEAYLEGMEEMREYQCQVYEEICNDKCGDGGDDDACEESCMTGYSMSYCYQANNDAFDVMDYAQCAQWNGAADGERKLEDNANNNDNNNGGNANEYYIGPHCAEQGGAIHLGLFTDDTCTTFSSLGDSGFYSMAGFELPYSDENLVSDACISCKEGENDQNDNDADDVAEMCETMYGMSGKCETKMGVDYPVESACTYIEGIKIIREDGVIRTSKTKKSKAAAVVIGLFTTIAVLLGAYVYYLRTKLGRAKINLSHSGAVLA